MEVTLMPLLLSVSLSLGAYLASIVLIIVSAHLHRARVARAAQLRCWKEQHMARERRAVMHAVLG